MSDRRDTTIIFRDQAIEMKELRQRLNHYLAETDKRRPGWGAELNQWFKERVVRHIKRARFQGTKIDPGYNAAVFNRVLGQLEANVEGTLETERVTGEARLNPMLLTKGAAFTEIGKRLQEIKAEKSEEERRRMVVVYIDLDDLKFLNDTLGHGAGDEFLKSFGQALDSVIRPSDLGVHFSGDEFGIIMDMNLPGLTGGDLEAKIKEIVSRIIGRTVLATGRQDGGKVEISVGYAVADNRFGGDRQTLVKQADEAMSRSKILRVLAVLDNQSHSVTERIVAHPEVAELDGRYPKDIRDRAEATRSMVRGIMSHLRVPFGEAVMKVNEFLLNQQGNSSNLGH